MAYSKAKLKSIGARASPCFKPFLIGNPSDTFLPTRTLLYVSVRLIFINLTSFLGIPNSMRILYKTSLLNSLKTGRVRDTLIGTSFLRSRASSQVTYCVSCSKEWAQKFRNTVLLLYGLKHQISFPPTLMVLHCIDFQSM